MTNKADTTQRIVIVGGGIAGLSAAVRLAQAGLPVTLLEASELGGAASTRNQGWLRTGALFALESPDYARLCHASFEKTLAFCPECIEPQTESMAYLFSRPDTLVAPWKQAWSAAEIPFRELPLEHVFAALPGLDRRRIQHAFQLPDRAIRLDVLLEHLAAAARNAGAEIRAGTPVKSLHRVDDRVAGVVAGNGEEIAARVVVLAAGTAGFSMCREYLEQHAGHQHEAEMVALKTHLVSFPSEIGRLPFCIPDADGLNHLPHPPASVFGTGRWKRVTQPDDQPDEREIELLRSRIHEFFPELAPEDAGARAWAGTMMQGLRVDQIEPGGALWPTVIDHSRHAPHLKNLISIFPGRATLWPQLAEEARQLVLAKLELAPISAAHPPWAV